MKLEKTWMLHLMQNYPVHPLLQVGSVRFLRKDFVEKTWAYGLVLVEHGIFWYKKCLFPSKYLFSESRVAVVSGTFFGEISPALPQWCNECLPTWNAVSGSFAALWRTRQEMFCSVRISLTSLTWRLADLSWFVSGWWQTECRCPSSVFWTPFPLFDS